MVKKLNALIITVLLLMVTIFSVLTVAVPNYYMKGKGCFGIFTSEMEGTACLGECDQKTCKGSPLCKTNKALPLVVSCLAILAIILCWSRKKNKLSVLVITFIMLMTSIGAMMLQTLSPMPQSSDLTAVSIRVKSENSSYSMGFYFSLLSILFGIVVLIVQYIN